MTLSRFFVISALIAPSALPAILRAQAENGAQIFTSINNSFPGGGGLAGFAISLGNGAIGVRGSFGVGISGLSASNGSTGSTAPRRWIGDGDLILGNNFGGLAGILGGALEPYAFAGVGAQSASASPSLSDAAKTWSYGGGVTLPLSNTLGISGEARQRNLLGASYVPPSDFVSGMEYRLGISFHFGSGRTRRGYGSRGSGASPSRPTGGSTSGSSRTNWPASTTASSAAARRVVPDAEQYIGVPYVYGGDTPSGFDCSGFVQYVYARQGVDLPRTSRQMAGSGMAVNPTPGAMAIGDLMLFSQGGRISHVAIYAGSGRFIHSSSSGRGVRYDDLNTQRGQWFADHLVAVRRVAGNGSAVMSAFATSKIPFDRFDPPDSAPPVGKH
ncbi:MAG: C40 family peptidase [Gemmatimonadota bacterium]|nr:C40 family peptidase [Gemmatimonadota bacterium]